MDKETLIEKLKTDLRKGLVVTVTGTGVSVAACKNREVEGFEVATWTGLIGHGLKHCMDLGLVEEHELSELNARLETTDIEAVIGVAELVSSRLRSRSRGTYLGWLKDTIGSLRPSDPEILKAIHSIPGLTATLNYDDLLEQATTRLTCTWTSSENIQGVLREERPASVLHLHGWWNEPDSVVFGIGSYLQIKDHPHTQALLRLFLMGRTLLFVGCGNTFADPNFSSLIEWGKEALKDVAPRHYLLCRSSDLKRLQKELACAPWLQLLVYGDSYEDLVPFLVDLAEGTAVMGGSALGSFDLGKAQADSFPPTIAPELLSEVGAIQNEKLDAIRAQIRCGFEQEAEEKLRAMPSQSAWRLYSPDIKARSFRLLAGLVLNRRGDVEEAKQLLSKARRVYPEGQFAFTEALIEQFLNGPEAALALLPNPAGRDEWHLRAVLLFNSGRFEEVHTLLQSPPFEPDAETCRLRALVYATRHEIGKARAAVDQALAQEAEWIQVRQTSALIDYLSALSPAFPAWNHWLWPIPANWRYVKQNPASRAALERAAAGFESIASREERGSENWLSIAIWQLAALASNTRKRTQAEALAKEMIKFAPTWFPVIAWSRERDFSVPLDESKRLLRTTCKGSACALDDVKGLFGILMEDGEFLEAGELLDRKRSLYQASPPADDLWRLNRIQVWLESGEVEKAEQFANEQTPDASELLRETIRRFRGQEAGWTKEQAGQLAKEFERTGTDASLFDACVAHHAAGLHEFTVTHADELIRRFETEAPLRLAMDAAVSIRDYKLCLSLMERYWTVVGGEELPREVRRLKGLCFRELGRLPEAEEEFRILAEQEESVHDRYALFDLQLSRGRVVEAAATARAMLNDASATGELLLHVAARLRSDNPSLARAVFAQALKKGLNTPNGAALAVHVGFPLGLDDQLGDYLKKALGAVGTKGTAFKPFTIAEFIEQQREWNQTRSKLEGKYCKGGIAAHTYAQSVGDPLVLFYHAALELIESSNANLERSWSLRVRHGSKRTPAKLPLKSRPRVFMELSSLLLAAHLEVLNLLEEGFGPIEISPWAITSLVEQIDELTSGQPSRIAPKEEILRMLQDGAIEVLKIEELPHVECVPVLEKMGQIWCNLLGHVSELGGVLVESFPLISNDLAMMEVEITSERQQFLRSCRDVLAGLENRGDLTSEQVEFARKRLESEGDRDGSPIDFEGLACVVLESGMAEQLSSAGVLRALGNRTKIFIRSDESDRLKLEVEQYGRRNKHVDWLKTLRERLTNGVESGAYVETPGSEVRYGKSGEEVPSLFRCLGDFLDQARGKEVLSCCDDRMLNQLAAIGESKVLNLFDLLWLLEAQGKLPRNKLFALLHRLRASNVRYLPVSATEIVHHLQKSKIVNGDLVENAELATIRRYIGACLLDRDSMQSLPANHPDVLKSSEVLYISNSYHVASETLLVLWKNKEFSLEQCRAFSDWVLDALWIDISAFPLLSEDGGGKPNADSYGLSEAMLIFQAIDLSERRGFYLEWVASRIGWGAGRLANVGKALKERVLSFSAGARGKERNVACELMGDLVRDLPQQIATAARFTKAELAGIGLKTYDVVNFGNHYFDGKHLWPVVRQVFKGRNGEVISEEIPKRKFSVSLDATKGDAALRFELHGGGGGFRLAIPALKELVSDDEVKRLSALGRLRKNLDRSEAEASKQFPIIAAMKRVDLRMRSVIDLRRNSFANQIKELVDQIRRERRFGLDLARPRDLSSSLTHLRLPRKINEGELPTVLNEAARVLARDEGFQEAFERVASLPVMLPDSIQEAFKLLSRDDRAGVLEKFRTTLASPLLRFHAAILFLKGSHEETEWAVNALVELLKEGMEDQWQLFQSILAWTFSELALLDEKQSSSRPELLTAAWIHAARLHQFLVGSSDPKGLAGLFRRNTSVLSARVFENEDEDDIDVADPRIFSHLRLIVAGIAGRLSCAELDNGPKRTLKKALTEACFIRDSGIVAVPLSRNRVGMLNTLPSFLWDVNTAALVDVLGLPEAEQLSNKAVIDLVGETLNSLEADSTRPEIWVMLAVYVGAEGSLEGFQNRVANLVRNLEFASLASHQIEQLRVIALYVFRQLARCKIAFERRKSMLLDLARLLFGAEKSDMEGEIGILLGNCALLACCSDGKAPVSARRFAELVASLCDAHPVASDALLKPFMRILFQQPTNVHAVMWRRVVELRCWAHRMEALDGGV